MNAEDRPPATGFARVVVALAGRPGVTPPDGPAKGRTFGSSALRVHDRIFALVSGGRLVLKLPAPRVAELLRIGEGHPYDAGKGRPMKEWVAIDPERSERWVELASEALAFVAAGGPQGPRR